MCSRKEVNVLTTKAKSWVGENGVFMMSWGLWCCTKGSPGGGAPIGAMRQKIVETRIGRRSTRVLAA